MRRFPPLYECSKCGAPVKVTPQGEGVEPLIEFKRCGHAGAMVYANRRATLYGEGALDGPRGAVIRLKLTVRQFLSALTGRSI